MFKEEVIKLGIGSSSSPGPDITVSLSNNQVTQLSCSSLVTLLQICLCPQEKKPHSLSLPSFLPLTQFQCPMCPVPKDTGQTHVFSSNTRVGLCVDLFAHIMTLGRNMLLSWNPGKSALGLLWVFLPHSVMLLGLSCVL